MLKSLNDITEQDLQEIRINAELFFTPKEIAIMLEIDTVSFVEAVHEEGTDVYKAFYGGRLQSEVDLRKSIIKLAKSGSSPAQTMALDMFKQSKIKLTDK